MSKIEIFLKEFVGLPGIKVDILAPSIFLIKDESCNVKGDSIKEIKATIDTKSIRFDTLIKSPFGTNLETIYEIILLESEVYEENTVLKSFTSAFLTWLDSKNTSSAKIAIKNDLHAEYDPKHDFRPTIAWINVAVRLGLVTVFDKEIKTTYSFKPANNIINFYLELPAEDLFKQLETANTLKCDNEVLNNKVIILTNQLMEANRYKAILNMVGYKSPIIIDDPDRTFDPYELAIINKINEKHGVAPIVENAEIPVKDGVTASTNAPTKEDFKTLIEAIASSTKDDAVINIEVPNKPKPIAFEDIVETIENEYKN